MIGLRLLSASFLILGLKHPLYYGNWRIKRVRQYLDLGVTQMVGKLCNPSPFVELCSNHNKWRLDVM